jgi:hypothetical protein
MKVVYTSAALRDVDEIADWLAVHYPTIAPAVERRIRSVIAHIRRWPHSARQPNGPKFALCLLGATRTKYSIGPWPTASKSFMSIRRREGLGKSRKNA